MRLARCASLVLALALLAGCSDAEKVAKTVTVDRSPSTATDLGLEPTPVTTFKRCDANITARKGTTNCAFASNVFYEYFTSGEASTIRAYSPIRGRSFRLRCTTGNGGVVCRTSQRGVVRFPQAAIDRYSSTQARRYARSHDVGSDSVAPVAPPPAAPPPAVDPEPDSTAGFCATHDCIPTFDEGKGDIVQCEDGMWSQSGGIQGACSGHGGVRP